MNKIVSNEIIEKFLLNCNGVKLQKVVMKLAGLIWNEKVARSILEASIASGMYNLYELKKEINETSLTKYVLKNLPKSRNFLKLNEEVASTISKKALEEIKSSKGFFYVGVGKIALGFNEKSQKYEFKE